jgi:hypothetical protein
MKQGKLILTMMALPLLAAGCDIFEVDNMDPPTSLLSGRVIATDGEPVGVRIPSNTAQLLLWQTDWDVENPNRIETSIPVHLDTSGEFNALLYDGEYEIEVVNGAGPWQNLTTRPTLTVNGATSFDLEVEPYYTIDEEVITYDPNPAPGGTITATFRVDQFTTSPLVELVGVYVNTTPFVDRNRRTSFAERARSQIQTELNTNGTITVTVPLPANIHTTPSPEPREAVHVRVGVKTVGISELAYSPVYKIAI